MYSSLHSCYHHYSVEQEVQFLISISNTSGMNESQESHTVTRHQRAGRTLPNKTRERLISESQCGKHIVAKKSSPKFNFHSSFNTSGMNDKYNESQK